MGSRCEAKKKNVKFDNDPRSINLRGAMESRHENSMRERRRRCNEQAVLPEIELSHLWKMILEKKEKKKEEEVVSRLKRNEKKRIRIEWNSDHRTSVVLKSLSNHSVRSIVVSKTYD